MKRKVLAAAAAGAVAISGFALLGSGPAGAAKPTLSGTLECDVSSVTTFTPGGVLALSLLDKPKDKKSKVATTTTYSNCTGTEPTSGLPVPTSGTATSKSKTTSRLCTAFTNLPAGKTKYLFGGLYKSKNGAPATTVSKADNLTPGDLTDDVAIPAATDPGFNQFLTDHGNDGTVSTSSGGTLAGKAYAGKAIGTVSFSGSLIEKVTACTTGPNFLNQVTSTGTITIG